MCKQIKMGERLSRGSSRLLQTFFRLLKKLHFRIRHFLLDHFRSLRTWIRLSHLKMAQQNGTMACQLRLVSCASPGNKHRSTKHAAQSPALRNRSVFAGRLLGAAAAAGSPWKAPKTFQLDDRWTPSLNPLCTATGNAENWLVSYETPNNYIQMLNQK